MKKTLKESFVKTLKGRVQQNQGGGKLYIIRMLFQRATIAGHNIFILLKGHGAINKKIVTGS